MSWGVACRKRCEVWGGVDDELETGGRAALPIINGEPTPAFSQTNVAAGHGPTGTRMKRVENTEQTANSMTTHEIRITSAGDFLKINGI